MSFYTLAISGSSHDSSICLMKDDEIVVMFSCERTNRIKHTEAILPCDLEVIGRYTKTIDLLLLVNIWARHDNRPTLSFNDSLDQPQYKKILKLLTQSGIQWGEVIADNSNHHLFHAAAGYYTSGVDEAIAIVIDSHGSVYNVEDCLLAETTSFFHCTNTAIVPIYKQLLYSNRSLRLINGWSDSKIDQVRARYPYPVTISGSLDIGRVYGIVTRYIGFQAVDAGKTMGMSAYGKANDLPPITIGQQLTVNHNLFRDGYINTDVYPYLKNPSDTIKNNIAYNTQKALEEIFVRRVEQAIKIRYSSNVIIGGGCGLNILGNSAIKKALPWCTLHPEPIGMDSSQSLGACLYYYKVRFPDTIYPKLQSLYLGPHYTNTNTRLKSLVEQYNNESTL